MKRLLCLLLLLTAAAFAQQESYEQLLKHWDYDAKAPLAIQEAGVQDRGGIKVHDISYAVPTGDRAASLGPNAGRVTASLVVLPGKGPFPAVIYGHWCMPGSEKLNRTEFLDEAVVLAHSGVVALLPDHVVARPGFVEDKTPLNKQQVDVVVQQVFNARRGADLLVARKDVDAKRLAYVGHSCNAEIGGYLAGIEQRFKALVIMAGPLSEEVNLKSAAYQAYRQQIGPEKFDAFFAKYSWADPGKYVSHSQGKPKLLQFAEDEPYLKPEAARQYLPYVSAPKILKIYKAPHALNAEATRDRLNFLAEQLGVRPLDEKLIAAIPPLVQPPWPKQ
jgi:dienelactone hydrolase